MLSPRQELLLRKVLESFAESGQPVGSKTIAADPDIAWGSSTVRHELARLEDLGLLAHPHTSAGRFPTDAGYRYYVDHLVQTSRSLDAAVTRELDLSHVRREIDEAMRSTSEALSRVTNLLAVVSAPSLTTTTIRHIEVLLLQPQLLMLVVITSTGGVSKRVFEFDRSVDPGLADWARSYLNEQLVGVGLGSRVLHDRLRDPSLGRTERTFINLVSPAFNQLDQPSDDVVYVEGASRLLAENWVTVDQLNHLMEMLERRVKLLAVLSTAINSRDVFIRIGRENEVPELQSFSIVGANYGLPQRKLGTVSLIGPLRMDYELAMHCVSDAAIQLSRFVEEIYND